MFLPSIGRICWRKEEGKWIRGQWFDWMSPVFTVIPPASSSSTPARLWHWNCNVSGDLQGYLCILHSSFSGGLTSGRVCRRRVLWCHLVWSRCGSGRSVAYTLRFWIWITSSSFFFCISGGRSCGCHFLHIKCTRMNICNVRAESVEWRATHRMKC